MANNNIGSGAAASLADMASLTVKKAVDKVVAYPNDIITYSIAVTNNGGISAFNIVITDNLPVGAEYVQGSLTVNTAYTGSPTTAITLTNPLAFAQTAALSFKAKIIGVPVINPLLNKASAAYMYEPNPQEPDIITANAVSNTVQTAVFKNNFSQHVSSLIESIALEEAALAAILNAEGSKIQRISSNPDVSPQTLVCLNKSVAEMAEAISILQAILRQKLNAVECQITGECK